ncbi:MAG: hypothetical protein H7Z42_22635 [Roseiflexaceae bacterium]|nr:hypothetical protein [Roseiflexaceae bacterium]
MKRMMVALSLMVLLLSSLAVAAPADAAPRTRCFSETGKCVSGTMLDYWERNGGLAVFGLPISDARAESNNDGWSGPTQWFERDRLEDHAAQGQGVLAGRLGVQYLDVRGQQWQDFPRVDSNSRQPGCRYFAETGQSLCGKFLEYWSKNGGLERFGFPVSQPMNEELAQWGGTVQYFERRRMELHPENAGTPYEVLLGLLGRDLNGLYSGACADTISTLQKTAQAFGETFSCGAPFPLVNVPIATQQFERGQLVWTSGPNGGPGAIFIIFFDNKRNRLTFQSFAGTWKEGDANSGGETPPAGLVEPIRGFGKLWRENAFVRNTLGWATAREVGSTGHYQYFRGGGMMIYRGGVDRIYAFNTNDSTVEDVARLK